VHAHVYTVVLLIKHMCVHTLLSTNTCARVEISAIQTIVQSIIKICMTLQYLHKHSRTGYRREWYSAAVCNIITAAVATTVCISTAATAATATATSST
jgi:hypothetical protein